MDLARLLNPMPTDKTRENAPSPTPPPAQDCATMSTRSTSSLRNDPQAVSTLQDGMASSDKNARPLSRQQPELTPPRSAKRARTATPAPPTMQQPLATDVIKTATSQLGAEALAAVKKYEQNLLDKGFSQDQIIKMAAIYNGAYLLETLAGEGQAFLDKGFTQDQIYKMVASDGGLRVCSVVLRFMQNLFDFGFTLDLIVKVAAQDRTAKVPEMNDYGAGALLGVLRFGEILLEKGFTKDQIFEVAAGNCGGYALEAVSRHAPGLLDKGFTQVQVINTVINRWHQ